jgi:hypothetical protein
VVFSTEAGLVRAWFFATHRAKDDALLGPFPDYGRGRMDVWVFANYSEALAENDKQILIVGILVSWRSREDRELSISELR